MVAALMACGGQGGSGGGEGEKMLKVALCVPITGESAKSGAGIRDTALMAFEDIGYMIGDYAIDLRIVDITTDPEKGALALEQAIVRDNVEVAILGWYTSVSMACMDVSVKYQIPYYYNNGAGTSLDEKWRTDPEKYNIYIGKTWPPTDFLSVIYVDLLNDATAAGTWSPRNNKIAIYGGDNDWGRSVAGDLAQGFTNIGWDKVFEDYFPEGATDFYAMLSKIKASDASLVAGTASSPASMAAFLKQARELEINAIIIADGFSENGEWYSLTGDAANYVIDCRPVFFNEAGFEFNRRFQEKYGYAPSAACEGVHWDHTNNFIETCRQTLEIYGELNSETLYHYGRDYVYTGRYEYTGGITQRAFKWTPETAPSPVVGEDYFYASVIQFIDGEMISVYPENRKVADFIVPDYAK